MQVQQQVVFSLKLSGVDGSLSVTFPFLGCRSRPSCAIKSDVLSDPLLVYVKCC